MVTHHNNVVVTHNNITKSTNALEFQIHHKLHTILKYLFSVPCCFFCFWLLNWNLGYHTQILKQ